MRAGGRLCVTRSGLVLKAPLKRSGWVIRGVTYEQTILAGGFLLTREPIGEKESNDQIFLNSSVL